MHSSRGFGLIEVLISVVVLSIGLLGLATLQSRALKIVRATDNYATASMLASEMAARMKQNQKESERGRGGAYIYSDISNTDHNNFRGTLNTLAQECYRNNGCAYYAQAANDLNEWQNHVQNLLPSGDAKICFDTSPTTQPNGAGEPVWACDDNMTIVDNSIIYTIKIKWQGDSNSETIYWTQISSPYRPWAAASEAPPGQDGSNHAHRRDWSKFIYSTMTGDPPVYPIRGSGNSHTGDGINHNASFGHLNDNQLSDGDKDWLCENPCYWGNKATINAVGVCNCGPPVTAVK